MLSPLFVDPNDPAAMEAALRSGVDALVLDLGDPHLWGDRAGPRKAAADTLARRTAAPGRAPPAMVVRLAPLSSGLLDADLDAVMAGAPDAVWLPGAVGARGLQHLGAKLAVREAEHDLPAGSTRIVAAPADTAAGVLALGTMPGASPRLLALVWDPAALAAALGIGIEASPVRQARSLLLIAAAAAGVPALDRSLPGGDLAAACAAARRDGFAGRVAQRPDELPTIVGVFGGRRACIELAAGDRLRIGPGSVLITPITLDDVDLEPSRREAAREGFAFLDRLAVEWNSGANRFGRAGECLLGAFIDGRLVGLGGLNRDPHAVGELVGRLRHLYVLPAMRGRGIGAAILTRLVAAAHPSFRQLRLRTDSAEAAAFYSARGFTAIDTGVATHSLMLGCGDPGWAANCAQPAR